MNLDICGRFEANLWLVWTFVADLKQIGDEFGCFNADFIKICGGFGPLVVDLKHVCGHFGFLRVDAITIRGDFGLVLQKSIKFVVNLDFWGRSEANLW